MLPAGARLRSGREITAVVRHGVRGSGGVQVSVQVRTGSRPGAASARVAFAVGRPAGGAVVRNRLRRRLRHLMAVRLAGLPAGTDVVVRAGPAATRASHADLGAALDRALGAALRQCEAPRGPR